MTVITGPGGPADEVVRYVACKGHHGLYVTNAYQIDEDLYPELSERWFGRGKAGYLPDWTEEIPGPLLGARETVNISVDPSAIEQENYVEVDTGPNFRQATRFSGAMRKAVQMQAGAGLRIEVKFSAFETVGLVPAATADSDTWYVKISNTGVYRQKAAMTCARNTRDCVDLLAKRFPRSPKSDEWEQIASASALTPFYEGSPFATCSCWAFSPHGLEARNTCYKSELIPDHPLGVSTIRSYLYAITFTMTEGAPVFSGITELENGLVLGAPRDDSGHEGENVHGNYWFPMDYDLESTFNSFGDVAELDLALGDDEFWEGEEVAPIYTWCDSGGTWRTFRWLSYGDNDGKTPDSMPAFLQCSVGGFPTPAEPGTYSGLSLPFIRIFKPVFEETSYSYEQPDYTVAGETTKTVVRTQTGDFAHRLSISRAGAGAYGDMYRHDGEWDVYTGMQRQRVSHGRIPLYDRQAMITYECDWKHSDSRWKQRSVEFRAWKWASYTYNGMGTKGDCANDWQPNVPNETLVCGNDAGVDVWLNSTQTTYSEATPGWENLGAVRYVRSSIELEQCAYNTFDSFTALYKDALDIDLGAEWEDITTLSTYGDCPCRISASLNEPSMEYHRAWTVTGDGFEITGSDSDILIGWGAALTQDAMLPGFKSPCCVLRDAFVPDGGLAYLGWESSQVPPDGMDSPVWSPGGGDGPYPSKISALADDPRDVFLRRRPVYVGVPIVCAP